MDLRQTILDAAKKIFTKDGYEATSIRKIASEIGFSPTTIYLYYKDKNDILYALHQEGFKLLAQQFDVLKMVGDPFERLKAMGRVYIQFALTNKEFYQLMFVMQEPLSYIEARAEDESVCWEEGMDVMRTLLNTIQECQAVGYFSGKQVEPFALMIWSTIHGMCTLALHGHLEHVVSKKGLALDLETGLDSILLNLIEVLETLR